MIECKCSVCQKTYKSDTLEEMGNFFYKCASKRHGYDQTCKTCARIHNRKYSKSSYRKIVDPQKHKARMQLNNGLASGKIKKLTCIVCGNEKSEGHHTDYAKPLEVVWLCRKHHKEEHDRLKKQQR